MLSFPEVSTTHRVLKAEAIGALELPPMSQIQETEVTLGPDQGLLQLRGQ